MPVEPPVLADEAAAVGAGARPVVADDEGWGLRGARVTRADVVGAGTRDAWRALAGGLPAVSAGVTDGVLAAGVDGASAAVDCDGAGVGRGAFARGAESASRRTGWAAWATEDWSAAFVRWAGVLEIGTSWGAGAALFLPTASQPVHATAADKTSVAMIAEVFTASLQRGAERVRRARDPGTIMGNDERILKFRLFRACHAAGFPTSAAPAPRGGRRA